MIWILPEMQLFFNLSKDQGIKWVHCLQMFCPSKDLNVALVNLIIIVIIIRGTTERYLQVILVSLPLLKITLASIAFALYTS